MKVEDTNTSAGQQPNPGSADGAATDATNPTGQQATVPAVVEGQGEGGDKTGDNAGNGADGGNADGKPAGDGQEVKTDAAELTGAPEAYADFSLPEGFALDGDRKDAALSLFRDLGLSQAGGQRAIDHFIKLVGDDDTVRAQAFEAGVAQQRDTWGQQLKADLGNQYDETLAYAKTAVQALQNPKLIQALDESGMGNHPELVKAFAAWGRQMQESPIEGIGSTGAAPEKKKPWDAMYDGKM